MSKEKKIFISVDIEGINGICCWDETEPGIRYNEFKEELQKEVNAVCKGAYEANAKDILIKDAHDSARNLSITDLPVYTKLLRGWEGGICSMMAGLDSSYDACMFVGYHSACRSNGNSLSHTMNTSRLFEVTINGVIASEFYINALYASYLGVPVAFLSGDENLTKQVKEFNENIVTVASKTGTHNAVISKHPSLTHQELYEQAKIAIENCTEANILKLPEHFDVKIQYKDHKLAYSASFYPGVKLISSDTIEYASDNYYDVLCMFKYLL